MTVAKNAILYNVVSLCTAALFAFLSVYWHLDGDYVLYRQWYIDLVLRDISSCHAMELGYCALGLSLKSINASPEFFIFLGSLQIYILAQIFVGRVARSNLFLSLSMFLVFGLLFLKPEMASHLQRQYIAALFILIAFTFDSAAFKIILVLLATMFHTSAIAFAIPVLVPIRAGYSLILAGAGLAVMPIGSVLYVTVADWIKSSLTIGYDGLYLVRHLFYKLDIYFEYGQAMPVAKAGLLFMGGGIAFIHVTRHSSNTKSKIALAVLSMSIFLTLALWQASPIMAERFFHYGKIFLFASIVYAAADLWPYVMQRFVHWRMKTQKIL